MENTVVSRRTFIHLISTSIESHTEDDAIKDCIIILALFTDVPAVWIMHSI
jgi:hypothetical protein